MKKKGERKERRKTEKKEKKGRKERKGQRGSQLLVFNAQPTGTVISRRGNEGRRKERQTANTLGYAEAVTVDEEERGREG